MTQESNFGWITQSCPTLYDPMKCSLPGSSVHGILQARILERVAILFSRGSSHPRDRTQVSCTAGRFFTVWATREAQLALHQKLFPLQDLLFKTSSASLFPTRLTPELYNNYSFNPHTPLIHTEQLIVNTFSSSVSSRKNCEQIKWGQCLWHLNVL